MATVYIVGNGTGKWNPPATTNITIECWGGGQASDNSVSFKGGNGSGYAKTTSLAVTQGTALSFSIGAPGSGTSGQAGGDTWLSNTGSAPASTAQGALAHGGNSATTQIGDTTTAGGTGGQSASGAGWGGAAGAAGPNGAGQNGGATAASGNGAASGGGNGGGTAGAGATTTTGATGGNGFAGTGGAGGVTGANGSPGGKGAGGGGSGTGTTLSGGAGGDDYDNGGGGGGGGSNLGSPTGGAGGTPGGGGGGGSNVQRGGWGLIKITYSGGDPDQIIWGGTITQAGVVGNIPSAWNGAYTFGQYGPAPGFFSVTSGLVNLRSSVFRGPGSSPRAGPQGVISGPRSRIQKPPVRDYLLPPAAPTDSSMITNVVIAPTPDSLSVIPPPRTLWPGIQGPDVAPPPQIGSVFTVQEIPSTAHPTSRMLPGIQGPNVASPPQIGEVLIQQEPGRAGWFAGIPGIQGPNVAAPSQIGRVVTVQELPGQPPSVLQHRIFGLNVRAPISDQIILRQQTPDHPPPTFLPGIQGPNVRPPTDSIVVLKPQDPVQPPSVLRTGTVGPANQDQQPPQGRIVILRQQQPDHPPPLLLPPSLAPAAVAGSFVIPGILVQGQFVPLDHPASRMLAGVQGPNVRPPTDALLVVRQQLPDHPSSAFLAGIQGPNVAAPPQVGTLVVLQELPGHPPSLLQHRVFGLNVRPPVTDWIIGRVPDPAQPPPLLLPSVPNIRRLVSDTVLVRQQQPDQPPPLLLPSVPNIRRLVSDQIILRQQQPDPPPLTLWPGVYTQPPVVTVGPVTQLLLVRQQLPDHPSSIFWHWQVFVPTPPPAPPPPRQHVRGNMVWLLADFVYSPDPPPTRTVFLVSDPTPRVPVVPTRTVRLLPDNEGKMQLPGLLSWGPTGPMDDDPFTIDATSWLATIPGDTIASVTANVYFSDGTAQNDVSITALTNDTTTATVWLTGGVPGTTYRVTFNLRTNDGRVDRKSVALLVVAARS